MSDPVIVRDFTDSHGMRQNTRSPLYQAVHWKQTVVTMTTIDVKVVILGTVWCLRWLLFGWRVVIVTIVRFQCNNLAHVERFHRFPRNVSKCAEKNDQKCHISSVSITRRTVRSPVCPLPDVLSDLQCVHYQTYCQISSVYITRRTVISPACPLPDVLSDLQCVHYQTYCQISSVYITRRTVRSPACPLPDVLSDLQRVHYQTYCQISSVSITRRTVRSPACTLPDVLSDLQRVHYQTYCQISSVSITRRTVRSPACPLPDGDGPEPT